MIKWEWPKNSNIFNWIELTKQNLDVLEFVKFAKNHPEYISQKELIYYLNSLENQK